MMPVPFEVSYRSSSSPRVLRHITTQDLQRSSQANMPKFEVERGRRRSLSPVPGSPPMASKKMYSPPPLTWSTAAQDAKAGVFYTKDTFPSSSFLPPPFSREPVHVEPAERVEILAEVDEYAVRVRVLRTGDVGLIPAWNTEGALERLTRINTAFNEAATCPVEARALRRRDSESSNAGSDDGHPSPTDTALTHVHSRCIPFATRVRYPDYYGLSSPFSDCDSDSDDSDSPQPAPPAYERGRSPFVSRPKVYEANPSTVEAGAISGSAERSGSGTRKSVNFAGAERPRVVFRYPSEEVVLMENLALDPDARSPDAEDADDEWWWRGWEEPTAEENVSGGERATEEDTKLIGATFDVHDTFHIELLEEQEQ